MTKSPITTVFFDMDETLVEHTCTGEDLTRAVFSAFEDQLPGVELDLFMKTLWQKAGDMWNMMFDGVLSGEIGRIYSFKNTLRALDANDALAEDMREAFEQQMLKSTRLMPQAGDVLESLKSDGYTVGMITNGYTSMQKRKIAHHGLDELLDHIFISEAMGAHKPDTKIFNSALAKTGAQPEQAVHVGDNLRADIEGAINAGLQGVLFDPKGKRAQKLEDDASLVRPTHIIQSLGDILPIVGSTA